MARKKRRLRLTYKQVLDGLDAAVAAMAVRTAKEIVGEK